MRQKTPTITIAPFAPSAANPAALSGAWQLAGWQDFDEAVMPALAVLGFADAGGFGIVRESGGAECYRIAPDKLWLRADNAEVLSPALALAKAESRLTMLDISHARMAISITGDGAQSLMTRVATIDIAALTSGTFAQTAIQNIPALIRRNAGKSFTILTPNTWHQTIHDYLTTNTPART
ncbi:MAG: hypothetical protein ACR2P4_10455 [Gammaproteobacteria bacterium]